MAMESWQDAFDRLAMQAPQKEAVVALQIAGSTGSPRISLTFKVVQQRSHLLQEALRSTLRSEGGRRWEEQGVLLGIAMRRVDPDFLPLLLASCRQGCTFAITSLDLLDKRKEQERRRLVLSLEPELFIFDDRAVPAMLQELATFSDEKKESQSIETKAIALSQLQGLANAPNLTFDMGRKLPDITAESVFCLMFTGGTNRTKVVQGKHSMILHERKTYPQVIPIGKDVEARVLQNSSCQWPAAVLGQLSMALAYEACAIVTETTEARELKQQMLAERVSVFGAVPDMLSLLAPENGEDFPHVRAVYSWAERLPRHIALKWSIHPKLVLRELLISTEYWLTFVSDPLADWTMNDGSENLITGGAVVRPVSEDIDVLILDVETGQRVGVGGVGELCLRGANVTSGYFFDDDNHDAFLTFEGKSYFRTKDLAKLLPSSNNSSSSSSNKNSNNSSISKSSSGSPGQSSIGGILFMGRADFQTKEKGQWVDLTTVERNLQDHRGVREAAIVQHPHEPTQFHAFVVFEHQWDCWYHLAAIRLMLPATLGLHVVQQLPRKAGTGKVELDPLRKRLAPPRPPSWPFEKGEAPELLRERRADRLEPAVSWTAFLALMSVGGWNLRGTLTRGYPGPKNLLALVTVALAYFPLLQLGQTAPRSKMLSDQWRQVPFGTFGPIFLLHALSSFRWGRKAHYLMASLGALLALRDSKLRLLAWPMVFWLGCGNQANTECNSWLRADTWACWLGTALPTLDHALANSTDLLTWKLWDLWLLMEWMVVRGLTRLDQLVGLIEQFPQVLVRLLTRSGHVDGASSAQSRGLSLPSAVEVAKTASGLAAGVGTTGPGVGTGVGAGVGTGEGEAGADGNLEATMEGGAGLASVWSSFDQCKAQIRVEPPDNLEAKLIERAQWIVDEMRNAKDDASWTKWKGKKHWEKSQERSNQFEEEKDNSLKESPTEESWKGREWGSWRGAWSRTWQASEAEGTVTEAVASSKWSEWKAGGARTSSTLRWLEAKQEESQHEQQEKQEDLMHWKQEQEDGVSEMSQSASALLPESPDTHQADPKQLSYEEEMGEAEQKENVNDVDNTDSETNENPDGGEQQEPLYGAGAWASKKEQQAEAAYDPWARWKARSQAEKEGKLWTAGQNSFGYDPECPADASRPSTEDWLAQVVEECYDLTPEAVVKASKMFPGAEQKSEVAETSTRLTDAQQRACAVLVRLLPHLEPVGPSTVLLGMDSLALTRLSGALRTELRKELSTTSLRSVNTVQQLFDLLETAPSADQDELSVEQTTGKRGLYRTWFSPGQYQSMGPWVFRSDEAIDHEAMRRAVSRLVDRHPALRTRPADTQVYRSFLLNASHFHLLVRHDLLSPEVQHHLGWAMLKAWPRIEVCSQEEIYGQENVPYQVVRMTGGQRDIEHGISDSRPSCERRPPFLATLLDVDVPLLGAWTGEDPTVWDPLVIFRSRSGEIMVVDTEAWKAGTLLLPDDPAWPAPAPPHFPSFYAAVLRENLDTGTGATTKDGTNDSNPDKLSNNELNIDNKNDDNITSSNNDNSNNDTNNDTSSKANSDNTTTTTITNNNNNNNNNNNSTAATDVAGLPMGTSTYGGSSSSGCAAAEKPSKQHQEAVQMWLRIEDAETLVVYRRTLVPGRFDSATSMKRYVRRSTSRPIGDSEEALEAKDTLKVSVLVLRCFHYVSDGMSLQPLISDLLDLYSAEKEGRGSELKLPKLPDGFRILEQRLKSALMGDLLDPMRHSLRCSYWNHRRLGYSHDLRIQGQLAAYLRTVARCLLIPMDYLMLSILMIAMARASSDSSVELILYVPMRDGQESSVAGLFADWREVFLPVEQDHATLVGTALLLEQTIRQRRWRVFNPLKKPELPVVNFDTIRSRRQASFLQLSNTVWDPTLNYPLGYRPTRRDAGEEEMINMPINFDIVEEGPDLWRLHSRLASCTHPPRWGQAFVAELKKVATEIIFYPMRNVHRSIPPRRDS